MATEKKYKLTDVCITIGGRDLYRIEALKDFDWVKKGDKGGFIESENNLSQEYNCWVCCDAVVYGDAVVCGDAMVWGNADIYGNAKVCGNADIYGNAKVCGNADIYGNAKVCGNAEIYGNAKVCGNA